MKLSFIDKGHEFDFGRVSQDYAKYRDIYPANMYEKLMQFGIGKSGQRILDLGSGTAVLPCRMHHTGADFVATDISEEQIHIGRDIVKALDIHNIQFKVCAAEDTGFSDNEFDVVTAVQCFQYFKTEQAIPEIYRILKPQGLFCKIFMDWLPFEDKIIAEMEELVLKYNPQWSGSGFHDYQYHYPEWARSRFQIDTIHSYNVQIPFYKENWIGRIKTCRGIGASLPADRIAAFESEYRRLLQPYDEPLQLKHQIHIEIYRSTKDGFLDE